MYLRLDVSKALSLVCLLFLMGFASQSAKAQVDFGMVAVGDHKDIVLTFTTIQGPLIVLDTEIVGPDKDDFQIINDTVTGHLFNTGDQSPVTVRFAPHTPGDKHATITGHCIGADGSFCSFGSADLIGSGCPQQVNVTLPAVDVTFNSTLSYHSDPLSLTFTGVTPSNSFILCQDVSNQGSLSLDIAIFGIPFYFRSSTVATVGIFKPGAFATLPPCQFTGGVLDNRCLLNGPFDPTHYYFEWDFPGFDVSAVFGLIPLPSRGFFSGNLTYWVDLNNLGLSPDTATISDIIQGAELYLHTQLSTNYVLRRLIGATPIADQVTVTKSPLVYNRVTGLTTQTITVTNKGTDTLEGPIQVVLTDLPTFVYVTPSPPTFLGSPYITASVSDLKPGASASTVVQFNNFFNRRISYTVETYSGTFLF